MSRNITAEPPPSDVSRDLPKESSDHFDRIETQFFADGQDGALSTAGSEYLDDYHEDSGERRWFALSRQFFIGAAVGGLFSAVLVGILSRHISELPRPGTSLSLERQRAAASSASIALANSASTNTPRSDEQGAGMVDAAAPGSTHQKLAAVVPASEADVREVGSAAEPVSLVAKSLPAPRAAVLTPPTAAAPAVEPVAMATSPAAVPGKPKVAAEAADDDAQRACSKAIANKQRNGILTNCEAAFAANPGAAEFAVALAKTEFDHGRIAQAFEWSKKAIAADPEVADPYVFVGEAEQNAGHRKAAKDAYLHYLRLAPSGRYAADLRAVLRSL
jgi:tetratricopeptide (TPR) repeat protein